MSTKPTWKQIYPWVKTAVINLDSVDSLLRRSLELISDHFAADSLLWVGLEAGDLESLRVYLTAGAKRYVSGTALDDEADDVFSLPQSALSLQEGNQGTGVSVIQPDARPDWLVEQIETPRLTQLSTGELIIPVANTASVHPTDSVGIASTGETLQFVLLLSRPLTAIAPEGPSSQPTASPTPGSVPFVHAQTTPQHPAASIRGWAFEELESLEIVCSQIGLAYSALYWRDRLEQSRQQAALVGRIARLLNSSLNPDEIVGRIVAELGQGLECDRCVLVALRDDPSSILASWEQPDQTLTPLEQRQVDRACWQNVVDMFLQGGASYLEVELSDSDPDPLQHWLKAIGAISALIVPLFIQEEFFGAVSLLSYRQGRVYQLDELQTIRQVADQAAIALTNAQHYQSLWYKKEALRIQNNSLQLEIIRDELTQLMNRRSLERELEQLSTMAMWAVQPPFSVIVFDIDYFKLVNDTYGHLIGDEVLQSLAQRLKNQLRKETPAYRYGGEEFVVILAETPRSKAVDVAERLRQAIRSAPMKTEVGLINITASFGVAQQDWTQDRNAWDVLHRSDRALYEAKRQGRDRVQSL